MQQDRTPGRIEWLDLVKGFAMLLVLLGHSMRDGMRTASPALDILYRACYIFHMTCFFWIAGYTYRLSRLRGRGPAGVLLRRLKKEFLPWAAYTLLIYAVFTAALRLPGVGRTLRDAGYTAMSPGSYLLSALQANNPWAYHLWFLYVLMLMTLVISLADAAFGGRRLREVCCVLAALGAAGMALRDRLALGAWWRLFDYISLYLPVMCLGVLMADVKPSRTACILWGGAGIAYIAYRAVFLSGFSGNSLRVESNAARFAVYVLANALLPGVVLLLARVFGAGGVPRTAAGKRFLRFLGSRSMLIYLLHQPFCCAFLGLLLYDRMGLPALAVMAVCLSASLGTALAAAFVWDRAAKALSARRGRAKT